MRTIPILSTLALSAAIGSPAVAGSLAGTVQATGLRDNGDAVVYIDQIPGTSFPASDRHEQVDQRGMVFHPHVSVVLVGTTVDFLNSDALLHNVFSPDKCAERFNLGSWPRGEMRSYTFKQQCAATLLCSVHPEMEAFVVAVPTPYFAVTDKTGAYAIEDLPDGTYTVKVWHFKLKETSRTLTIAGDAKADFELKK